MHDLNAAITIRSFDTSGAAFERLRSFAHIPYINTTGRHLPEDDLVSRLGEIDIAIAGTERYTRRVIEAAPRLKIISRVGIGLDSIDLACAKERGIAVLNTPGSTVQPVAEHTLALLFSVLRNIPDYNSRIRSGDFSVRPGTLLAGKRVGIVGLGRIGSKVAGFLEAMGCRINYYDPIVPAGSRRTWTAASSLEELFAESEIVTLHSGAQAGNASIVTPKLMTGLGRGVILINTARGSLIDEKAFIDGLKDGKIIAAGLDVFPQEPYSGPLLAFPQVIATPHVASNTVESREQMEMEAVENIIRQLEGRS